MANEKVLGLVSGTRDGKLLVVTTPTRCDPPATGEVYAGLVSGTRNGKPLLAFSTQRCGDTAGTLENGQTYLGLVSGTRDGKLLLAVPCGDCDQTNVTVCDVTRCCELDASVRIKIDNTPTWTDWEPLTLTCGGEVNYHDGHGCCGDGDPTPEDECVNIKVLHTVSEKDTLASPEPYDDGVNSGTRSAKTVIWTSGNFAISGTTYRLSYYVSETHIFQTAPTVSTTDECWDGYMLQELVTSGAQWDIYGDYWNTIAGGSIVGDIPYGWAYNYDNDNPYGEASTSCPDGYNYASGELIPEGCSFSPSSCAEIDIDDPCNTEDLV